MAIEQKYNIQEILRNPKSSGEISKAMDMQKHLRLHASGEGYKGWWMQRVLKLESERSYEIKKNICAITTPRMVATIKKQFYKIFRAKGRVFNYNLDSTNRQKFEAILNDVCHGLSIDDVMQILWHDGMFEDPNSLIGVELKPEDELKNSEPEPYVVVYPTNMIHDICIKGGEIEYLAIKCTTVYQGKQVEAIRLIDEEYDTIYVQDGSDWVVALKEDGKPDQMLNFFGEVPFTQLSTIYNSSFSWYLKNAPTTNVLADFKKYLNISDDHYLSVKYHQHPQFYSFPVTCPTCNGSGEVKNQARNGNEFDNADENLAGESTICSTCSGTKVIASWKADPTQGISLPIAEVYEQQGFPAAPAPAGYVTPPIEVLAEQRTELEDIERQIEKGSLGIEGIFERATGRETATGRELDMQPLIDTLSSYSANAEYVRKFLTNLIGKVVFGANWKGCEIFYGRKYFIRSEDNIMKELEMARKAGATISYMKELQDELTYIRFERNPEALSRAMILNEIEPFNGFRFEDVNTFLFINEDDYKVKVYFNDFIERFETENGNVVDYVKSGENYKKKLQEIKLKLREYARETQTVPTNSRGGNTEPQG